MSSKKQFFLFIFLLAINLSVTYSLKELDIKGQCNGLGAWGIVKGEIVLLGGSLIFLLLALKLLLSASLKTEKAALILVLSGGVANFFERILYGCVFDYLSFIPYWPVFNLADCLIVLGIGIYFVEKNKKTGF